MDRINTLSKAVDLFGSGKHGFKDQQAPGGETTALNKTWFNGAQEEVMGVIEAGEIADDPDASKLTQLLRALRTSRIADALFSQGVVTTTTQIRGLVCHSERIRTSFTPGGFPGIAGACGVSRFLYSIDQGRTFTSKPPGAGVYNDIAVHVQGDGDVFFAAVGDGGAWFFYDLQTDTLTTGITAGAPDLQHLINTGNNWVAVGTDGVWRAPTGISPAPPLVFTQLTATEHQGVVKVGDGFPDAGRIIMARPGESKLYYSDDDGTTLVAGATGVDVYPDVKPVFDPESGLALFSSDETSPASKLIGTANGVVVADQSPTFSDAIASPVLLGLRAVVILSDPGSFTWVGMPRGKLPRTGAQDWFVRQNGPAASTFGPAAGSDDFAIFLTGDTEVIHSTPIIAGEVG